MSKFVEAVLRLALGQDGVREARAANTGPEVNRYLASVGLAPGYAWCAAFVYWAISGAAKAAGIEPPFLRSAYCPDIHSWARHRDILHGTPQPGDAFLYLVPEGGRVWAHHIGLVTAVGGGRFRTIEGNTNRANSSEGDGVYQRDRPISASYAFVRWVDLLPPAEDAKPETYELIFNGKTVTKMPVWDGRSFCHLRVWAECLGKDITWDDEAQLVSIGGRPILGDVRLAGGASYAPIADLARAAGMRMDVDVATHKVWVPVVA
jgi:hypothetical protein